MNNNVFNLFVPNTIDGSCAAIIAHLCAHSKNGTVTVTRCENNDDAVQKVQQLLHYITMADGYKAPQPERREIWIVGFDLNGMTWDELNWFRGSQAGRIVRNTDSAYDLYISIVDYDFPVSLGFFLSKVLDQNSDYSLLYNMLNQEDYEHLIAYLLFMHPMARDVAKEDYVLNMFVEHEKKRRASYI